MALSIFESEASVHQVPRPWPLAEFTKLAVHASSTRLLRRRNRDVPPVPLVPALSFEVGSEGLPLLLRLHERCRPTDVTPLERLRMGLVVTSLLHVRFLSNRRSRPTSRVQAASLTQIHGHRSDSHRLLFAALAGAAIDWNRFRNGKPAGGGTHALVGLGAGEDLRLRRPAGDLPRPMIPRARNAKQALPSVLGRILAGSGGRQGKDLGP